MKQPKLESSLSEGASALVTRCLIEDGELFAGAA
jgi:hypothetical protein